METNDKYRSARRQVERKLRLYAHLAVYLAVNSGLILVNLARGAETIWSIGLLFGWGIGLVFHALIVFSNAPAGRLKQRMIEDEIAKQDRAPSA